MPAPVLPAAGVSFAVLSHGLSILLGVWHVLRGPGGAVQIAPGPGPEPLVNEAESVDWEDVCPVCQACPVCVSCALCVCLPSTPTSCPAPTCPAPSPCPSLEDLLREARLQPAPGLQPHPLRAQAAAGPSEQRRAGSALLAEGGQPCAGEPAGAQDASRRARRGKGRAGRREGKGRRSRRPPTSPQHPNPWTLEVPQGLSAFIGALGAVCGEVGALVGWACSRPQPQRALEASTADLSRTRAVRAQRAEMVEAYRHI